MDDVGAFKSVFNVFLGCVHGVVMVPQVSRLLIVVVEVDFHVEFGAEEGLSEAGVVVLDKEVVVVVVVEDEGLEAWTDDAVVAHPTQGVAVESGSDF